MNNSLGGKGSHAETHNVHTAPHNAPHSILSKAAHSTISKAAHTAYKVSKQIAYDIAIGVFVLLLVILIIVLFSVSFQKSLTKNNLTVNENLTVAGSTTIAKNLTVAGTFTAQTYSSNTNLDTITADGITINGTATSTSTPSVGLSCNGAGVLAITSGTSGAGTIDCDTISLSGNVISSAASVINITTGTIGLINTTSSDAVVLSCSGSNIFDIDGNITCDDITSSGTITIGTSSNSVELSCTTNGIMAVNQINCPAFSLSGNSIASATGLLNISTGYIGLFNTSNDAVTLECSGSGEFTVGGSIICTNITIGTSPDDVSLSCTAGGIMTVNAIDCPTFSLSGNSIDSADGLINISTGYIGLFNTSNDAVTLECSGSGEFTVGGDIFGNTIYSNSQPLSTSDYRLKEEIEPISDEYSIDKLKPCSYLLKADESKTLQTGFIAHELQEIFPHLVKGEKDAEEMQYVNYIGLIAILTKELQSLKSVMAALKADNIELKADITMLKADNIELKADNIELKSRIIELETH